MDVVNDRRDDGSIVQFTGCKGNTAQQWYWQWNAGASAWNIIHAATGKCLDLPNANTTNNGAQLQIYQCLNNVNQKWLPSNA